MTTPWDIYAEQLFPLGYGHPLWIPEPYVREVDIGDVGWIKEGEFRPLFNSMKDATHPVNDEKGVPPFHEPFAPSNLSIASCDRIMQQIVCSRNIRTIDAHADVSGGGASSQVSAGAGFRFQATSDAGAFVMLEPPARSQDIESKRHIVNYMRDHFEEWIGWANSCWGLELREQDIIFVCSTTKTTRWAVAAFHGSMFRKKEGHVQGDFGPFASGGFTVNISNQTLPAEHYRTGPAPSLRSPSQPSLTYPGHPTPTPSRPTPNQCLFVHFYKMRRRFWLLRDPMRATAGPHQLPPGPDSPGMESPMIAAESPSYEFALEEAPGRGEPYDPVNLLLDYILSQSEAEYAIASDLDLIAIFTDGELPIQRDIPAALQRLSPVIEVDERNVGTISVDLRSYRKRKHEDTDEAEQKRPRSSEHTPHERDAIAGPSGHLRHFDADGPSYDIMARVLQVQGVPQYPQPYLYDAPYAQEGVSFAGEYLQMPPDHSAFLPEGVPYAPQGMPYPSQHVPPPDYDYEGHMPLPPQTTVPPVSLHIPAVAPPNAGDPPDDDDGHDLSRRVIGATTRHHEGSVTALAYSPDGRYAASGSEDTSVILWDVYHHISMHKVEGKMPDTVSSLAFSRDNRLLACATHGQEIVFLSVDNGLVVRRTDVGQSVHSIAYTPDGDYLIGGVVDGTLRAWDTVDYIERLVLTQHTGVVAFITFSPDGHLMATGGAENECYIWETANLASGTPRSVLEGHKGMVCAAAFSPDNRRVVTASDDGSSRIWNAETGDALVILHEHTGPVWAVAFSPNGKRVASGSSDSTVKVCDSFRGEQLLSLEGHHSMVNAVDFSMDGKYIASAAADNTVRLWNADNGVCIRTYNEHNDNVTMAKFSSDSSSLMSGSHDGTVLIRPLPVAASE